eukprot:TRINITY_DN8953_c0_g2_i2.p1 TRINITY_DN8953_c0_g2~~TRINITY_DN8953_c0_g2_i2.p1  ORF type:complete len:499 (+),score=135.88 TRINITY_DN8953_c0_g2_i2:249-1745(+)
MHLMCQAEDQWRSRALELSVEVLSIRSDCDEIRSLWMTALNDSKTTVQRSTSLLQQISRAAQNEIATLKASAVRVQQLLQDTKLELDRARIERDQAVTAAKTDAARAIAALDQHSHTGRTERQKLEDEIVALREELQEAQDDAKRLREALARDQGVKQAQLQASAADFHKERGLLRASIDDLERFRSELEKQLQTRTEQYEKLRSTRESTSSQKDQELFQLRTKVAELQADLAAAQSRLPSLHAHRALEREHELDNELAQLRTAFKDQLLELQALRDKREAEELQHLQQLREHDEMWANKLEVLRKSAEAELSELRGRDASDKLAQERAKFEAKLREIESVHQGLQLQLQSALDKERTTVQSLTDKLELLTKTKSALETELGQLRSASDAQSLRAQLATAQAKLRANEDEIAMLQSTVKQECEERAEMMILLQTMQAGMQVTLPAHLQPMTTASAPQQASQQPAAQSDPPPRSMAALLARKPKTLGQQRASRETRTFK